jgi:hypothetical protein
MENGRSAGPTGEYLPSLEQSLTTVAALWRTFLLQLSFTSISTVLRNHMCLQSPKDCRRHSQTSHSTHATHFSRNYSGYSGCTQTKPSSPDSHLNVSSFNVLAKMRYQVAIVVAGACSAFASPHTLRERNIVDDIQDSYDFVIVGGKSSCPVHKAVR